MRILVVGATGVIGRRLLPLLVAAGHEVTGTTRSADKQKMLQRLGAKAAVVDAFDAAALTTAVQAFKPDVVIHQLTDLPDTIDPAQMPEVLARNARVRIEGTRNLMDAAQGHERRGASLPRASPLSMRRARNRITSKTRSTRAPRPP